MITIVVGILCIAAIFKVRKMICKPCLDGRIFLAKNPKYSRAEIMKPLAYRHPDLETERDVRAWLYPEE